MLRLDRAMFSSLRHLFGWIFNALGSLKDLVLENPAPREQTVGAARQASTSPTIASAEAVLGFLEGGRRPTRREIRELICRMAAENLTWGAPRVHGELVMLGFEVSEPTTSRWLRVGVLGCAPQLHPIPLPLPVPPAPCSAEPR